MAIDSIKTAGSTLKNIQTAIDVIANNIANVNTQGFKEKNASFESVMSTMHGETTFSGSIVGAINTNFRQGPLKATTSGLDLALSGSGLFAVENGAGDVRYTRSGSFGFDAEHNLVDPAGNYLMSVGASRITIPSDATQVQINSNGEVLVQRGEGPDSSFELIDQIQLVNFTNPAGLESIGQNLYRETANSGQVEFGTALGIGTSLAATTLIAGSLEQSNVDLSTSLVNLVALQRSYQAVSKAADTDNQIAQTTLGLAS